MGGKPKRARAEHAAHRAKAAGADAFQTDQRFQGRMAIGYLPVEEARRIGMPVLGEFSAPPRRAQPGERWRPEWAELAARVRAMLDTVADVVAAQEGNFEATEPADAAELHELITGDVAIRRAVAARRDGESKRRLSDDERELWEYANQIAKPITRFHSAIWGACAKWNPFGRDSADAPFLFRELIRDAIRYLRGDAPRSLTELLPSVMRELGYSSEQIRSALRLDGEVIRQRESRGRAQRRPPALPDNTGGSAVLQVMQTLADTPNGDGDAAD